MSQASAHVLNTKGDAASRVGRGRSSERGCFRHTLLTSWLDKINKWVLNWLLWNQGSLGLVGQLLVNQRIQPFLRGLTADGYFH